MRGRKLLDQTLPTKGSRNPSFPFGTIFNNLLLCHTNVKILKTHRVLNIPLPCPAPTDQNLLSQ
jgi:hypothetical protein